MELNKIYKGDSLEVLKTFPDESINMVVTSPPYWALRDYGTASWNGGDENCDHETMRSKEDDLKDSKQSTMKGSRPNLQQVCDCGAIRKDLQLGLEPTFHEYINRLCDIFDEIKRVLRKDGTCWVNLGDTYNTTPAGNKEYKNQNRAKPPKAATVNFQRQLGADKSLPHKSLLQIPSRFAIEMANRGWILRNEIIWHKPNCMPSSAKDRFTVDFEKLFFFTKSKKYNFEQQLEPWTDTNSNDTKRAGLFIKYDGKHKDDSGNKGVVVGDPSKGRNMRTVWRITTKPYKGAHFAVFPPELIKTPIKAGCPKGGIVLDPFMGSGTTAFVARELGRNYVGIELNEEYIKLAEKRLL